MIARIVEKYRFMAEAAALKEQVQQAHTTLNNLENRAHNHPPELVDADVAEARAAVTEIWETLDAVETELAKPEPEPSRLRMLADKLLALCKTMALYCGGKIDIGLNKAAEELGWTGTKWAIRATAATFAAQQPQIQSFAKASWASAGKPGG